jgi:ADP-ribosylglycohydrolase
MGNMKMLGALAGDIIGSTYESRNVKSVSFDLFPDGSAFTDDSVMTLAVAKWLLDDKVHSCAGLIKCMQELGRRHKDAGYGPHFLQWLFSSNPQPYNSWGNGAGMRVSPVGLYAKTLDEALALAAVTASISHNHAEGVKGAQAIAASVFLCKHGRGKQEIKEYIETMFGYDLDRCIADIRRTYCFDVSCQGSVPEAIIAFLEGNSFEEVIRLAISIGGDSDTIGCMAGAIAACCYEIPDAIASRCDGLLTPDLREIKNKIIKTLK